MLRVYHLLIALLLLALSPFIFKLIFPKKQQPPQQIPTPEPTTSLVQSNPVSTKLTSGNAWKSLLGKAVAPPGWKIRACDGDKSLLCVSSGQNRQLGQVELRAYPVSQEKNFQKMLLVAGIPTGFNLDYQSQIYQPQLINALNAWVIENYAHHSQINNKPVLNNSPTFAAYPTQKVKVGNLQGIRYGFAKMNQNGELSEQKLGYVAFDGYILYDISTGFAANVNNQSANNSNNAKFNRLESFAVFTPYLDAIASELKLP